MIEEAVQPDPEISIHAPLAGSDDDEGDDAEEDDISIHAPLAGSDEYKQVYSIYLT